MKELYKKFLWSWSRSLFSAINSPIDDPTSSPRSLFFQILSIRWRWRVVLLSLGLLFALTGLTVPITQKIAIDALAGGQNEYVKTAVFMFVIAFFAMVLTRTIELIVRAIGMQESVVVETWLAKALYKQALSIKPEYRRNRSVGETVALMASHLQMVSFFLTDLFPAFFVSFIPVIIAPFILSFYFDITPLPVFGVVIISLIFLCGFAYRSSRLFQGYKIYDEVRLGTVNEWIQNIRALRILSWTEHFEKKLIHATAVATNQRVKVVRWSAIMNSFSESVPMILNIVGIMTLLHYHYDALTPGDIFGVLWVLAVFLAIPMRTLPWTIVIALDADSSLRRINEFLRTPTNPLANEESKGSNPIHAASDTAISVKDLSLKLNDQVVLEDISFTINSGEFIAIIGDVGAGKTQLFHCLLRESPANFEHYEVFGRDTLHMSEGEIKSYFGIAPQDSFTFNATLLENVLFDYDDNPPRSLHDRVYNSLQLAAYESDLKQFPDGLHSELGERGVNLSGGQRQRLGLARAHHNDRPIILLDDSLSALDSGTEELILNDLLLDAWKDKTRILITHRLSVLPFVDRIFFIKEGRLSAQGTLHDLQENKEFRIFVSSMNEASSE